MSEKNENTKVIGDDGEKKENSNMKGDYGNILILLFLYLLQGKRALISFITKICYATRFYL